MTNLAQRALTALIAGSAAVAIIVLSQYGLLLFCMIVSLAGLWECLRLFTSYRPYYMATMGAGVFIWLGFLAGDLLGLSVEVRPLVWMAMPALVPLLGLVALYNEKEKQPLQSFGGMVLGLVYCFLPLVLFYLIAQPRGHYDYRLPLGILLLTWGLDVGAYFAGKYLGRKALFPRISPKKTWAGSIGGGLICLGVGLGLYLVPETSEGIGYHWLAFAAIIAVFSQLGDLAESMLKRSAKIKDSGSILPGHGGMLDRFDGMYFSIPLIYFYLSLAWI